MKINIIPVQCPTIPLSSGRNIFGSPELTYFDLQQILLGAICIKFHYNKLILSFHEQTQI